MLLPANRTEQGWWQRHVEPNERPPFGCCLVIWTAEQTRRPVASPSLFESASEGSLLTEEAA